MYEPQEESSKKCGEPIHQMSFRQQLECLHFSAFWQLQKIIQLYDRNRKNTFFHKYGVFLCICWMSLSLFFCEKSTHDQNLKGTVQKIMIVNSKQMTIHCNYWCMYWKSIIHENWWRIRIVRNWSRFGDRLPSRNRVQKFFKQIYRMIECVLIKKIKQRDRDCYLCVLEQDPTPPDIWRCYCNQRQLSTNTNKAIENAEIRSLKLERVKSFS